MSDLLTTRQVAERLGFAPATLNNWRSAGKGPPFVRIGRSVRYPADAVEDWKREQAEEGTERGE